MPNSPYALSPASNLTRIVYAVGLILIALPSVLQVRFAWKLLRDMSTNPNVVNPISAIVAIPIAITVAFVVGYRLQGLVAGRFRLESLATSGAPHLIRRIGLFLMYAGVLIFILTLSARITTGIGAVMLIASMFQSVLPVGLVLFEFSRLLERESLPKYTET